MLQLLRKALLLHSPEISKEDAIRIAHEECRRRGWPWQEKFTIRETLRYFHVQTRSAHSSGNVWIRINMMTGQVEGIGYGAAP